MQFLNKTAVITGAGSGIGALLAKSLAKEGANVVLADINETAIAEIANEIIADGGSALAVVTDVTKYSDAKMCCDTAVEKYGSLDILVPCAGGSELRICNVSGEFHEVPIDVFDFGLDLNLKGAFYFAHAACAHMAKQNSGVIIPIGSITGHDGGGDIAYSTSKSGLMTGFVKSLAQYGSRHNIRAVCIAPGPVLTRPAMAGMKTLLGRAAQTQEIVDLIMYVASEKGAFINGTTFLADGGRSALYRV